MKLTNLTGIHIFIFANNKKPFYTLPANEYKYIDPNQFFYIMILDDFNNEIIYSRYGALPEEGTLLNINGDYVIQNNQGDITTRFALLH